MRSEFRAGDVIPEAELLKSFAAVGPGVKVYAGCRVFPPDRVSLGDCCQIDEGVFINAGQGVFIGRHVHLAMGSSISGGGRCLIEDFAGIGVGVRLITGSEVVRDGLLTNPTIPERWRRVQRGEVRVGAHAVVFTNSVVLPDVVVGEGAIVAAGSIVHHDLKPWGIYGGNPLVQVGIRDSESVLRAAEDFCRFGGRSESLGYEGSRQVR
jgi:galactoside O-acetyltransferase